MLHVLLFWFTEEVTMCSDTIFQVRRSLWSWYASRPFRRPCIPGSWTVFERRETAVGSVSTHSKPSVFAAKYDNFFLIFSHYKFDFFLLQCLKPVSARCLQIWNHPDVLYEALQKENQANEQDLDLDDISSASNPRCPAPSTGLKAKVPDPSNSKVNNSLPLVNISQERANQVITYEWVCPEKNLSWFHVVLLYFYSWAQPLNIKFSSNVSTQLTFNAKMYFRQRT